MIAVENVAKAYDTAVYALNGVNLRIAKGECCFLIGPSGAGKTTLLNLFYGLERPTAGTVTIAGIDPARAGHAALQNLRRRIGFVFQDLKLIDDWTAYDNVAVVLEMEGKPRWHVHERVWKALEWASLSHRVYVRAGDLSGGERQRLALVRAMIHTPEIILADEPVANVDPETARFVMNLLFRMHTRGATVVIASHASDYVMAGANVIHLEHGRIKED